MTKQFRFYPLLLIADPDNHPGRAPGGYLDPNGAQPAP